jgi:hypothetical protein
VHGYDNVDLFTVVLNLFTCNHVCFSSQRASHGGEEINEVVGYALSHKGKAKDPDNRWNPEDGQDTYTNANVQPKLAARAIRKNTRTPSRSP